MSMDTQKTTARAKRFYEKVTSEQVEGGFEVRLDGRGIKTPLKNPLIAPTRTIAQSLVDEWDAQEREIEPSLMPLTKMLNTAIDRIPDHRDGVIDELVSYAGSDMVCYRASDPESLVACQREHWDPLLTWLKEAHDISLNTGEGVIHITQDSAELEKVRDILRGRSDLFLSGFHSLTTLSGSVTIALACAEQHITADQAWKCAHLDADWQALRWGRDEEAQTAKENAYSEFEAAYLLLKNL